MQEEKIIEQAKPTEVNSQEAPLSIIERAEAANKKAEENIKRQEELLARQEAIAARQLLSGRSEGTQVKTPVDLAKEDIDKRVAETLKRFRR